MQIVLSVRHGEVSDRMEEWIREQFSRLSRYEPRVSRVEVTLSEQKDRWEVAAHAHVDRAEPVHARDEGPDARSVVDAVSDKMARQLRRLRDRHVDHKGPAAGEMPPGQEESGT